MESFFRILSDDEIYAWETWIGDWFFVFAIGFLIFELIRYLWIKKFSWTLLGDTVTNYLTLAMFIVINVTLLAGLYLVAYFGAAQFAVFEISSSWATILICIVLADLAYYWEHRFMHRMNFAWATHSVHHSSPYFNISVAYRFGPMDGVWPVFFHLPLVLLGFNPFVVFFSEMLVQVFQTLLHTEAVKKLPRPIESLFNTPSHHRVHHASNRKYLDANYAGIFIVWDRLFGTYVQEDETIVYGLVKPINSVNPLVAFFHGFVRLGKNMLNAPSFLDAAKYFFGPPEWKPKQDPSK